MQYPLVTVITPYTDDRYAHMQNLTQYLNNQEYKGEFEQIVIDGKGTIAQKRNSACAAAYGDIIMHCDSDDWFAPDWIQRTVDHMLLTGCDCTGLDTAWFYKAPDKLWQYRWNGRKKYCVGGTLAYTRDIWKVNHFRDTADGFGEDTLFVSNAGKVVPHDYIDGFVAMIHDSNSTSHRGVMTNPRFFQCDPIIMQQVMGADCEKYPIFA